jgi:hypothetical protein
MIAELDEAIRELLYKEIPLRKNEVDIVFDQPKREWSARLTKPTINMYLFDLKENVDLRGSEQWSRKDLDNGMVELHRNPVRVDLEYLITAWAKEVLDEHRLLSNVLILLLRTPRLENEYLPEALRDPIVPVRLEAVQTDVLANPSTLWNTLDNVFKPGIRLKVTLSIDPHKPLIVPAVSTTEISFKQNPDPELSDHPAAEGSASKAYYTVRGKINSGKYSLGALDLVLSETGRSISLNEGGEFALTRLEAGEYHLSVSANSRLLKRQKIVVPSANYDFEL